MKSVRKSLIGRQVLTVRCAHLQSPEGVMFVPSFVIWPMAVSFMLMLGLGSGAHAKTDTGGCITISALQPYDDHARTPRISGIEFDDQSHPWVIDGLTWQMRRLDKDTGAVMETYVPSPTTEYNHSLAWTPFDEGFYTMRGTSLYRIDIDSDTRTVVGRSLGWFNFTSLAFHPEGTLWLATDHNGGELWSVDPATSAMTFQCAISGLQQQLHALTIDDNGEFFVASSYAQDNRIWRLDPESGDTSLLTNWTDDRGAFIVDMDIDPTTGRWFGIREARGETPRGYYFVELVGVPEPSSTALLAAAAACAAMVRRRR